MYIRIIGSSPGECAIILFDCGSVITIDCCKTGSVNHAIDGIKAMGVDPDSVIYNVITHFHDDHIKGASELVTYCTKSKIVIPDAWTEDVFKRFVATVSEGVNLSRISVTREIEKIFDVLRGDKSRLFTVGELSTLYPPPYITSSNEKLTVLTPTSARKAKFLSKLASDIELGDTAAYGFCERSKNDTSICCLLSYNGKHILLGGDVENNSPDFDITSVHDAHLKNVGRYELVKLPHHGSKTSFCDKLRGRIDDPDTIVAITPYPKGPKPLPNQDTVSYLNGAKKVLVLAGRKQGVSRNQRMRRNNFMIDPIPKYHPGIMDFMDGNVVHEGCQGLEEYIAQRR